MVIKSNLTYGWQPPPSPQLDPTAAVAQWFPGERLRLVCVISIEKNAQEPLLGHSMGEEERRGRGKTEL
jgi:hypothetical protein